MNGTPAASNPSPTRFPNRLPGGRLGRARSPSAVGLAARGRAAAPATVLALAAALLCSGGCLCPKPQQTEVYLGPTEPMSTVVRKINANNLRIESLWAHHNFDAVIVDEKKKSHAVSGEGALLYLKPRDFLLRARAAVIDPVFEIGSNPDEYWLGVFLPEVYTQWWGHYRNVGKPCSRTIGIHPDLVIEVLGISDFAASLLEAPVPTMRFNNEQKAYMFTWSVPLADRWVVTKEVWFDLKTYLPTRVLLYDPNGRVVLRAALSEYEEVGNPGGPLVATRYHLLFPDSGSMMMLKLSEVAFKNKGVPRPGGIKRVPRDLKEVRLDEDCND